MEYEIDDEERLFDESTNPSLKDSTTGSLIGAIWRRTDDEVSPEVHSLQTGELTPDEEQLA